MGNRIFPGLLQIKCATDAAGQSAVLIFLKHLLAAAAPRHHVANRSAASYRNGLAIRRGKPSLPKPSVLVSRALIVFRQRLAVAPAKWNLEFKKNAIAGCHERLIRLMVSGEFGGRMCSDD